MAKRFNKQRRTRYGRGDFGKNLLKLFRRKNLQRRANGEKMVAA